MERTAVLVHGAWHGAWCWSQVVALLDAPGVRTVAVDLPSVNRPDATLTDDADHVRAAIDAIGGPVVLVGHSYGGAVVTDAGAHPAVDHVVYLTAFALDTGESILANELKGGEEMELGQLVEYDGDVMRLDLTRAIPYFFHDCTEAVAADAVARLRDHSIVSFGGAPRAIAWREKPSTYVVCTDDQGLPEALQRSAAARCERVIDWPTSHSPFLSRPDLVADLVRKLCE
ncbi:MAG: alpha/beta hydrolase [Actinomycetota bacterium]|nr:alpha/beta hydrolase [Actinomycetota bacterium]